VEFYLQIYFLIYSMHPSKQQKEQLDNSEIVSFKIYLESKGIELSKTSEFLPYYALPFIHKPQENKALKHLFTPEWIESVRQKLDRLAASGGRT